MLVRVRRGKMSDTELASHIGARMSVTGALTQIQGISQDRAKALKYYRGDPLGIEVAGRSQVVSRDVQETVDGLMPSLMKVFGSGPPVEMKARRAGQERGAEQATDLINHVWNVQNNGFQNYYTWFKDALLQRLGTVKIWWDKSPQSSVECYQQLTEQQFQMLQKNDDVTVESAESYELELMPGVRLYDVEARVIRSPGKVCVDPIPPENFLFDYWARDIKSSRILGDMWEYTASELVDLGYDRDLIDQIQPGGFSEFNLERLTRVDQSNALGWGMDAESDPASAKKWVYELYMPLDYDGDGYAEMRRIVCAGPQATVILANDEVDSHPYACLTPTIMPHRIEGLSIADQTMDLQEIKTVTLRQSLDGMYQANSPMWEVVEGQVNIDDMLISRPGGIKRVKAPGMIRSLSMPFDATLPMAMIGYMDKVRELRTGLPQSPGELSDDVISQDGGATGANIINDARMERVELITRTFAETGVRDAFGRVFELLQKYQDKPMQMRMGGAWADIDPREWREGFDMEIKVGLGSGKKDQMLMHLMPIKQTQEQILMQFGPENPLVGLEQYHNTLSDLVKNAGLGDPARYWKNPTEQPPYKPQPKQDPAMMKAQADIQLAQMKAKLDAEKAQQEMALEREKAQNDMALERFKMEAKIQLERENAIAQAAVATNAELARSGMYGNASADGIPPDDPQASAVLEDLLAQGLAGLDETLGAGMEADPMEPAGLMGGMPAANDGMAPVEELEPEGSEDEMQTKVLTSLAETLRQQGDQTSQALQSVAASMAAMAQAVQKIGGPRKVRRGSDGKIEGVE
jgi:hypothetical protein